MRVVLNSFLCKSYSLIRMLSAKNCIVTRMIWTAYFWSTERCRPILLWRAHFNFMPVESDSSDGGLQNRINGCDSHRRLHFSNAYVLQLAERIRWGRIQCEFESHHRHHFQAATSATSEVLQKSTTMEEQYTLRNSIRRVWMLNAVGSAEQRWSGGYEPNILLGRWWN